MRSLILSNGNEPIHITDARHALMMVLEDKADVVVDSETVVHSQYLEFNLPLVIRLHQYVYIPRGRSIPLTTRTVLARDRFRCAYCWGSENERPADTMDHVLPRAQGGKHLWENVVGACRKCNHKKGNKTPEQANMPLQFEPSRPRGAHAKMLLYSVDAAWEPYLLSKA